MLYKCLHCTYISDNKCNMYRHMKCKHAQPQEVHDVQPKVHENPQKNTNFKCIKCNKYFNKNWLLSRHTDTCKGIYNPFECKNCNKALSSYSSLSRHRKTCTGSVVDEDTSLNDEEIDFNCEQCYKSFDKNWLLTRHKLSCTGKLHPNECISCHRILPSCSALSHHKKKCIKISEVKQELINTVPPTKDPPPIEPIIQPVVVENKKYKKVTIPQSLRAAVWDKYIGRKIGEIECLVCNTALISQLNFHCGHVVAEANGGTISIDNLRPICKSCNCSMGTNNLEDYKNRYFKCENAYKEENIISNEYRKEII